MTIIPANARTAERLEDIRVSVRDLSVRYNARAGQVHAVSGVNFDIRPGETLGLVGETGAGKSATARALIQLVGDENTAEVSGSAMFKPMRLCSECHGRGCGVCEQRGKVSATCTVCGGSGCASCDGTGSESADLLALDAAAMRRVRGFSIAMIFQDPSKALNPTLTIRDQLAEVFAAHRLEEYFDDVGVQRGRLSDLVRRNVRHEAGFFERQLTKIGPGRRLRRSVQDILDERVAAALSDTRIPNPRRVMRSYPHELSGGMRQRVMIAQAIACRPELLIADEPTTALDVTVQARILDLMRELQTRYQTSMLYVTHDLAVVRRMCDRLAVMYAGKIVETGTVESVFKDPKHPYTRGLMGAIPSAHARGGALTAIEGSVPELVNPAQECHFHPRCAHAHAPCRSTNPSNVVIGRDHEVACFLYGGDSHADDRREDRVAR